MRRLVIVGAGGHGREALDVATAMNEVSPTFEFLGFLDDGREPGSLASPHDHKILGGVDELYSIEATYVVAVGDPGSRRRIVEGLQQLGREPADLIHPSASIGSQVTYGHGLIMAAGARVTHGVDLGSHVHINVNASISHDCRFGSYVTVTPGAHVSGAVSVGDEVWLGIGAVVKQGVSIGSGTTVGAGSAVIDDLPPGCTAIGVPAKPLTRRSG